MVNFVVTIALVLVGVIFFSAPHKVEPIRIPVKINKSRRKKR